MRAALVISLSILLLSSNALAGDAGKRGFGGGLREQPKTRPLAKGRMGHLQRRHPTLVHENARFPTLVKRTHIYAHDRAAGALVHRGVYAVETLRDGSVTRTMKLDLPARALKTQAQYVDPMVGLNAKPGTPMAFRQAVSRMLRGGASIDRCQTRDRDGGVVELVTMTLADKRLRQTTITRPGKAPFVELKELPPR